MLVFLRACVVLRKNIILSGSAGTGKTALLNILASLVSEEDRVLLVERHSEIELEHPHVVSVQMGAAPNVSMRSLLNAAMNMWPKRVIVGEIEGSEALELVSAMSSGQSGCMSCIRALSPRQALARLERLSLSNELDIPLRSLREEISLGLDIVVHSSRFADGSTRVNTYFRGRRASR